jgi:hypothetical protein
MAIDRRSMPIEWAAAFDRCRIVEGTLKEAISEAAKAKAAFTEVGIERGVTRPADAAAAFACNSFNAIDECGRHEAASDVGLDLDVLLSGAEEYDARHQGLTRWWGGLWRQIRY